MAQADLRESGAGEVTGERIDPETGAVLAEHNGRRIDLSQDWEGAETCVEQDDGDFVCYEDDNAYRAAESLEPKDLSNVGFRNRANTIYNARTYSSVTFVTDKGNGDTFGIHGRYATPHLGKLRKTSTTNWTDKIDEVILRSQ